MDETVLGIFHNQNEAANAITDLENIGYNPKDISIAMKNKEAAENVAENTGANVAEGTVSGLTTGAIIGALAGLLAATVVPGLGAIFIGGPIAEAIGLGGAAATTASGAITGGVAGGLIGALTRLGLSPEEAQQYQSHINSGGILVAVPARRGDESQVRSVLEDHNADQVRIVNGSAPARSRTEQEETGAHYGPAYYSEVRHKDQTVTNDTDGDDYDASDD